MGHIDLIQLVLYLPFFDSCFVFSGRLFCSATNHSVHSNRCAGNDTAIYPACFFPSFKHAFQNNLEFIKFSLYLGCSIGFGQWHHVDNV